MIKMLHSGWAYITLLLLIIAVVNAIIGLISNKEFKEKDLRISLFTLIVTHIQVLIGFIAFFTSAQFAFLKENGMKASMEDTTIRLIVVEHPIMMILAVVFITIGFSKHKSKITDSVRFKTIVIFYGIALAFILSKIPWSQWLG
ncbi:MAG: hypothetical protein L3J08_00080 [Flavobacteriaceae bacterium]|nr:hypothetical protein [Flavobacteriaceae bacterium]